MIVSALPADPLDRFEVVPDPDPDAEPADLDRFLDAIDQIVERRFQQRDQNETGGPAKAARFCDSTPSTSQSQEVKECQRQV